MCKTVRYHSNPSNYIIMYSSQSASALRFGQFPSEQREGDFISSLLTQSINVHEISLPNASCSNERAVAQNDSAWFSAVQMDHGYAANLEPSTLWSPTWEEPATVPNRLNMSTYFSTFDPSAQCQEKIQLPGIQNKFDNPQQSIRKNHPARINCDPTTGGNFKSIAKRKRKRTVFRTEQVEAMEEVFARKPYVTKEDRQTLVEKLQISDKSVKVWFQNRRLKIKRGEDQYYSDDENRTTPEVDRLDYVESKIQERTNEFGYVTLDDKILMDLVSVIDDYLKKPQTDVTSTDIKMEINDEDITTEEFNRTFTKVPEYEPISPASTIDNSNDDNSWAFQSKVLDECLQRLVDIESIISM